MSDYLSSNAELFGTYATLVKDAATAAAILVGGIWAIIKFKLFRQHRQIEQTIKMGMQLRHVWLLDRLALYVTIEVENIGLTEIRLYSSSLKVQWLIGESQYSEECRREALCDTASTDYVIDKGETATFTFACEVPLTSNDRMPTACRLHLRLWSERKSGERLSWAREQLHVLEIAPNEGSAA
jgi:hypothetical protein